MSIRSSEKVLTFLNHVERLAAELKSMNVYIADKWVAMAPLNGIPKRFQQLVVAIDILRSGEAFTFDLVKSRLLQREERAVFRAEAKLEVNSFALLNVGVNEVRNGVGATHFSRNTYICTNCGRSGHTVKNVGVRMFIATASTS